MTPLSSRRFARPIGFWLRAAALGALPLAGVACGNDAPGGTANGVLGGSAGSSTNNTTSGSGGTASTTGGSSAGNYADVAGSAAGGTETSGGSAGNGNTGGSASAGGSSGSASGGGTMLPEVSPEGDGDFNVGPNYTTDPDVTDQGKPKGKKFSFSMSSATSQIFKGDDATLTKPWRTQGQTSFSRNITVYVPALYKDGTEAPVMVIQDGPGPIDTIARAIDNLSVATDPMKKIPAFIAVAVANGSDRDGSDGRGSERGLEYDTMSDRYSRFIDTEVLPAVAANALVKADYPNLKFTSNPQGRAAFGCSSGGAAALSMVWFANNVWNRAITYSGTFVAQQNSAQPEAQMFPYGAWEYHSNTELIKNNPFKALRVTINANQNDLGAGTGDAKQHDWLLANQRTAAALKAKGYHYRYHYAAGLGHCDFKVEQQTIAENLSWLWRGYVAP